MTPIAYEEAAKILGVVPESIRHAVGRGVLTRLPRVGKAQPVIKEQVLLFAGPGKRLSKKSLNPDELSLWHQYAQKAIDSSIQGDDTNILSELLDRDKISEEVRNTEDTLETLRAIMNILDSNSIDAGFSKKHPFLAITIQALFFTVSVIAAWKYFESLTEQDQENVMAHLVIIDRLLLLREQESKELQHIEEIRQRRKLIYQFREQVGKAA